MKKALHTSFLLLFFSLKSFSQLLSWSPDFILENSTPVVITMDASKGNQGLLNYTPVTDVYVHIGVITNMSANSSDWKYVNSVWVPQMELSRQCLSAVINGLIQLKAITVLPWNLKTARNTDGRKKFV